MKIQNLILILVTTSVSFQVLAWGQTGHRVTGAIAEAYLSDEASNAINKILTNEDLAEVSTYADEMRSNPKKFWQRTASPWHYVNVHKGKRYSVSRAPSEGDAVTALKAFSETLKDPKSSIEDRRLALKFIVHIIGDLHQPFHTGTNVDLGGNKIKLSFFGKESNLHRVWDSGLIDRQKLSYSEWHQRLQRKISPAQAKKWMQTDPEIWVAEAAKLRLTLYPKDDKLSWTYQYQNVPIVKQQLKLGGVRIAAYLNELFDTTQQ